jgi:hypothetical protein
MFYFLVLTFISLFRNGDTSFVKNANLPICKKCVFYIPKMTFEKHEFGKCIQFGQMDIVTGEIFYEYAAVCRSSETKCGLSGKYYQEKEKDNINDK